MQQLTNKVAIVTGASSGIGLASARLFAREGAAVVLSGRNESKLAELEAEIRGQGGKAVSLAGDLQDEGLAEALVALAVSTFGGLDIAFNNGGTVGQMQPIVEMSRENWDAVLATNLTAAFHASRFQLPAMLERGAGSLVFTSSFVGYTAGFPGMAAYGASKAGLIGLVKGLATEYGSQGIRVNALLPGGTDTPMGREFANTPEALAFVQQLHAVKRLAEPEEIAQAALYLASDASRFTTGTAMLVDGGVSVNRT